VIFRETPLAGAYLVELERLEDDRGHFARTYCRREMAAQGLEPAVVQASTSFNRRAGTVRGMHYQAAPRREAKLVRCTRGAIFDAIVDLRRASPTRGRSFTVTLSPDRPLELYVPPGFAHGFQALEDDTEVGYQMSEYYEPGHDRGFRWDDPEVGIAWPLAVSAISERDRSLPAFADRETGDDW
jgi:dTDP-4-dehydrorhamnose 3,5-epimerase